MAQISQAQGDLVQAQTHLEEVLLRLESDPELPGAERPFRVHLICYQVLHSAGNTRARPLLERAYHLLQARAARIPDEAIRHSFLQNIVAHRELVQAYEAVFAS